MKGGLWIVLSLSRLAGRYAASLVWVLAAVLATLLLDMPLHAPLHRAGFVSVPGHPRRPAAAARCLRPRLARKEKVKLIEFASWEQVRA